MDKCNTLEIYLFCDVFKLMVIPACLKGSTQAKKKKKKKKSLKIIQESKDPL